MLNEDDVKLSGYYDVVSVEIKSDNNEIVQIGFYYNLDHVCVEKVSVLKKGHHY